MINGTTQMNLENIMLSGRCQSPKDKHCMIPLEVSRVGKSIQTETGLALAKGWGKEGGSACLMGVGFPLAGG